MLELRGGGAWLRKEKKTWGRWVGGVGVRKVGLSGSLLFSPHSSPQLNGSLFIPAAAHRADDYLDDRVALKNAAASVGRLRRRVTHETFSPTVQLMLLRSQWVELRSGGRGGGGAGRVGGERPIRLTTEPWLPLRLEQNSFVACSFWIFSSDGKTKHSANSVAGTLMLFSKEEKTVLCKRCCKQSPGPNLQFFPFFPMLNTHSLDSKVSMSILQSA